MVGPITTVAGGGFGAGEDIPATTAFLSTPRGIATDEDGNLFIAALGGSRVRAVRLAPEECEPPLQYEFEGFLSPLNNLPTINRGPAGRTFPVKWILPDGDGAFVSDSAAIVGVAVLPGSCTGIASDIAAEETTLDTGGLKYDPLTGIWQFNWKTAKTQTGCWTLEVRLADGSVHPVGFELR